MAACREFDLRIGFYSSLMDWHHPDGWRCAFDTEARLRFNAYIQALNRELLTQYGKIDILWYDVARPMETWEGWDSLELNQMVRELQPHILINNRTRLDEDFGTPEEHLTADGSRLGSVHDLQRHQLGLRGFGAGDPLQLQRPAHPQDAQHGHIGRRQPAAEHRPDARWLGAGRGGRAADDRRQLAGRERRGSLRRRSRKADYRSANGVSAASFDGKNVYIWNWIWPTAGEMALGGFVSPVKAVRLVKDGSPVAFEQRGHRILLKNLPKTSPDAHAGVAVLELEFDAAPEFHRASYYPQLHGGQDWAGENKI